MTNERNAGALLLCMLLYVFLYARIVAGNKLILSSREERGGGLARPALYVDRLSYFFSFSLQTASE